MSRHVEPCHSLDNGKRHEKMQAAKQFTDKFLRAVASDKGGRFACVSDERDGTVQAPQIIQYLFCNEFTAVEGKGKGFGDGGLGILSEVGGQYSP